MSNKSDQPVTFVDLENVAGFILEKFKALLDAESEFHRTNLEQLYDKLLSEGGLDRAAIDALRNSIDRLKARAP